MCESSKAEEHITHCFQDFLIQISHSNHVATVGCEATDLFAVSLNATVTYLYAGRFVPRVIITIETICQKKGNFLRFTVVFARLICFWRDYCRSKVSKLKALDQNSQITTKTLIKHLGATRKMEQLS